MLRTHRVKRYAARLKELIRCTPVDPLLLTEGEAVELACCYADATEPTVSELLFDDDLSPVCLYACLKPAPTTLWDEDAALLSLLIRHFSLRVTPDMGLALYTATLCRSAGMSACPEPEGFERPAFPEGEDLGDLLVAFLYEDPDPIANAVSETSFFPNATNDNPGARCVPGLESASLD